MLFRYFILFSIFVNLCSAFSFFKDRLFDKSDNFYIFSAFSVIISLFSLILISNVLIFSFCNEIYFSKWQILSSNSENFSDDSSFCFWTSFLMILFCYWIFNIYYFWFKNSIFISYFISFCSFLFTFYFLSEMSSFAMISKYFFI